MKTLLLSLLLLVVTLGSDSRGTTLGLGTLKLPVYLHGSDSDSTLQIVDVPYVAGGASPEWWVHALALPFQPPSDKFWREKGDINMVSKYQIAITCKVGNVGEDFLVTIDATKAKVPEGYPFAIEQVVEAAATCVRLMYPDRPKEDGKLSIKIIPASGDSANPAADGKGPAKAEAGAAENAK